MFNYFCWYWVSRPKVRRQFAKDWILVEAVDEIKLRSVCVEVDLSQWGPSQPLGVYLWRLGLYLFLLDYHIFLVGSRNRISFFLETFHRTPNIWNMEFTFYFLILLFKTSILCPKTYRSIFCIFCIFCIFFFGCRLFFFLSKYILAFQNRSSFRLRSCFRNGEIIKKFLICKFLLLVISRSYFKINITTSCSRLRCMLFRLFNSCTWLTVPLVHCIIWMKSVNEIDRSHSCSWCHLYF